MDESNFHVSWEYNIESKEVFKSFIEIPKKIRLAGINTPILIRPHPSESHEIWRRVTVSLPNITITNSSPLINYFPQTKLVIHNRCTTSIEAFMYKIPVISYEPIKLTNCGSTPPEEFINSVASL